MKMKNGLTKPARTMLSLIVKKIDRRLISSYGRELHPVEQIGNDLLGVFRRGSLLALQGLSYRLVRLEGPATEDGASRFKVLYAGDEQSQRAKSLEYLERYFFEVEGSRQPVGNCPAWALPQRITEQSAEVDLVVIERNALLNWLPPDGEWAVTPTWLRMVFRFEPDESWEDVRARMRRQKHNIRLFRKANLDVHTSKADKDFELFFHRMHVPMIKKRHEEYGTIDSKQSLYHYFKQGMLMLAYSPEGEPVAGDLLYRTGDTLFAIASGVVDGSEEWINRGALSALYYHEIEWCHANGLRKYDVGECRPFAEDGLYLHKRRWGMNPQLDPWGVREWVFWAPAGSSAGGQWLHQHPLIEEFARYGNRSTHARSVAAGAKTLS